MTHAFRALVPFARSHTPFDAAKCLVFGIPLPMVMLQEVASKMQNFRFY